MAMTRRQLIKTGIAGSIGMASLHFLATPWQRSPEFKDSSDYVYTSLNREDRDFLAAIIPIILKKSLQPKGGNSVHLILIVIRGVDEAIIGLSPTIQKELRELFMLLHFTPTRRYVAKIWGPWLWHRRVILHPFYRNGDLASSSY